MLSGLKCKYNHWKDIFPGIQNCKYSVSWWQSWSLSYRGTYSMNLPDEQKQPGRFPGLLLGITPSIVSSAGFRGCEKYIGKY